MVAADAASRYMRRMTSMDTIREDFRLIDDWEDRYRYVIELGEALEPLPASAMTDANKVQGCVSQVWLETEIGPGDDPVMTYRGASDAHIVRGLVAIMLALFSRQPASRIVATDAEGVLRELGLDEHLTPQRSNGLRSMVQRIKRDAQAALTAH